MLSRRLRRPQRRKFIVPCSTSHWSFLPLYRRPPSFNYNTLANQHGQTVCRSYSTSSTHQHGPTLHHPITTSFGCQHTPTSPQPPDATPATYQPSPMIYHPTSTPPLSRRLDGPSINTPTTRSLRRSTTQWQFARRCFLSFHPWESGIHNVRILDPGRRDR